MATIVAALIGAAATAYGAKKAKDAANKASGQQDRLYGVQADIMQKLAPYAQGFYERAKQAYDPAAAYYKALASGDRNRILAAVSPQLQAIGNKYRSVTQASRELNPRSGAGSAYNADLAYRSADEQQSLINQQQQGAYANLASMAGTAGSLGSGAMGGVVNAASGASTAGIRSYAIGSSAANDQAQAYAQIAKSLADAWDNRKH